jgi:hypothetical protein
LRQAPKAINQLLCFFVLIVLGVIIPIAPAWAFTSATNAQNPVPCEKEQSERFLIASKKINVDDSVEHFSRTLGNPLAKINSRQAKDQACFVA